ncbi:MAG: hypothetical protein ACRC56_06520 [Bosea sp. (in: a-proteobacteria)]
MGSRLERLLRSAVIAAALVCLPLVAEAQYGGPGNWPEEKCARYRAAYAKAIARQGLNGIGNEFQESHAAFLASGCLEGRNVCPRSKEELNLANTLVILAMNGGMASTFLPFACRKPPASQP